MFVIIATIMVFIAGNAYAVSCTNIDSCTTCSGATKYKCQSCGSGYTLDSCPSGADCDLCGNKYKFNCCWDSGSGAMWLNDGDCVDIGADEYATDVTCR